MPLDTIRPRALNELRRRGLLIIGPMAAAVLLARCAPTTTTTGGTTTTTTSLSSLVANANAVVSEINGALATISTTLTGTALTTFQQIQGYLSQASTILTQLTSATATDTSSSSLTLSGLLQDALSALPTLLTLVAAKHVGAAPAVDPDSFQAHYANAQTYFAKFQALKASVAGAALPH